jgi:histidinol-phosphate phosphatase family protein
VGVPAERIRVVEDAERRGPAFARNAGWRASSAAWIVFLDDDVLPEPDWLESLCEELAGAAVDVAAVQGRIRVPLPEGRRPTDWERNVAGLETARWATADLGVRREALARVGGFDPRFPRAFREDADLGLRLEQRGWRLERGRRTVLHPPGPADFWTSVRLQRGNADDALMLALHGRGWHERAGAPLGRRPRHVLVTAAGTAGVAALALGRRRLAVVLAVGWLAGTAELAWRRIAPGPRDAREAATMLVTSAAIPPAAVYHWLQGLLRARRLTRPGPPQAVLLDRDGTLVEDVPYNGDPARVVLRPRAREAVERLRAARVPTAVVSNQSGVGRGLISRADVDAVNRRVEELLGPLGPWLVCTHAPDDGCSCRKPAPGLVLEAASALGVAPERCALIGDVGADMDAARAAGARAVLVPNGRTRPEEIEAAPEVAADLGAAVDLLVGGRG